MWILTGFPNFCISMCPVLYLENIKEQYHNSNGKEKMHATFLSMYILPALVFILLYGINKMLTKMNVKKIIIE